MIIFRANSGVPFIRSRACLYVILTPIPSSTSIFDTLQQRDHENRYFVKSVKVLWCFCFLDTIVIAYMLYGSNSQGREAIEELTVRIHVGLSSSSLF